MTYGQYSSSPLIRSPALFRPGFLTPSLHRTVIFLPLPVLREVYSAWTGTSEPSQRKVAERTAASTSSQDAKCEPIRREEEDMVRCVAGLREA